MKKFTSILLAISIVLTTLIALPLSVSAATGTGKCGDNLTWSLDSGGTLTISGRGDMYDYRNHFLEEKELPIAPWKIYYYDLVWVEIKDGVTSIGNCAFMGCGNIRYKLIPHSVTSIGDYAFYNQWSEQSNLGVPKSVTSIGKFAFHNTHLTSINIPNIETIGDGAFAYCESLTSVTIGSGITNIGDDAFYGCQKLTDVYYDGTEDDRSKILIGSGNDCLTNATWHYADIELDKVQSVKTNDGDSATMRFFFEPEFYSEKADGYGAYIVPLDIFDEGDIGNTALVKKDQEINSGETYSADLRKIPSKEFDTDIMAIPFLKFGNSYMTIVKPDIYIGNNVNATNIDKEEK